MARNNITYLRANLRSLIDDPSDGNTVFSEDDLDDALWKRKDEARYYHLDSVSTISAGGTTTTYLTFDAPVGNWATDVALVDSSYNALSPVTSDYVQGRWTFSTEPKLPVMITGYTFDLYGAAGDLLIIRAAKESDSFDVSADGMSMNRNQKQANYRERAADYHAKARVGSSALVRTDEFC